MGRGRPARVIVHDPQAGTFLERVERWTFADAAAGREPVKLRLEHDPAGPVYARTVDGTPRFDDQSPGLLLAGALSKSDPATQLAVADIRGDRLTGLPVGTRVVEDSWSTAADNRTALRTIRQAALSEVSFTARPANPQAQITSVRHETRSADGIEYRCVDLRVAQRSEKYTAQEIIDSGSKARRSAIRMAHTRSRSTTSRIL
jgi:HK97 family phage prohead protease